MNWKKSVLGILCTLACLLMISGNHSLVQAAVLDSYQDGKIYDVTQYGADATGKSSSDQAIQAACAAARRDFRKGTTDGKQRIVLYFPEGKYKIATPIRLYDNMAVVAEKATISNVKKNDSNACAIRAYSDAANIVVDGGTWECNAESYAIAMTKVKNFTIQNASVKNGKSGIAMFQCQGELKNISVSKCKGLGLQISLESKIKATKCKIKSNGSGYPKKGYLGHGVGVYSGSVLEISDSEISKNRECGISMTTNGTTLKAKKCKINDNGRHALGTHDQNKITMTSCTMYRNGEKDKMDTVILVGGSKGTFTSCTFANGARSGIYMEYTSSVTVKKCTFKGNMFNINMYNNKSGKVKATIDSCTFGKCKVKGVGAAISINNKSQYSLKVKGKNKYATKDHFAFYMNNVITIKK